MFNRKISFIILFLTLILFLTTTITATDTNQTSEDNNIHTELLQEHETNTQIDTTQKNNYTPTDKKIKKDDKTTNTTTYVNMGNYNKYFNSRGRLYSSVSENSTIILNGEFENKNFEISKARIYLTGNNATIRNGQIRIAEEAVNSTVTNITVIIKDTDLESTITNKAIGTTITNNNLTIIKDDGSAYGIKNIEDNVKIINNTIKLTGPAPFIDWSGFSEFYGQVNASAIFSRGDNIAIENNYVDMRKSENSEEFWYGTMDALEINGNHVNIINNTIKTLGGRFTSAIYLGNARHSNIKYNNISVIGERYVSGIGVPSAENLTVAHNSINAYCHNSTIFTDDDESLAYGICVSSYGGWQLNSNVLIYNNTINLDATIGYGMEIYTATKNVIKSNKINVTSVAYASGIVFAHSPNNTVISNYINTIANSSVQTNSIVEEIRPANKGIGIQQNSDNLTIINNTIKSIDYANNAYSIYANSSKNILIENNTLDTNIQYGQDSVGINAENVTVKNIISNADKKTAIIQIIIPENIVYGSKINLKAKVIDNTTQNAIVKGKVVFKINQKTIATAKKIDNKGMISIEYDLTGLSGKNYMITAVFGSNNEYNRAENSTTMNIRKLNVKFNRKTISAYSGENILINETLFDENNKQLTGKNNIAIKVNGKTIAHSTINNGKLLVNVEIPKTLRASNNNTLEIIIGENNKYSKTRCVYTLKTLKQKPVFSIDNVEAIPGTYITLKATIKTNVTGNLVESGSFVFKINGVTQKDMDIYENVNTNKLHVSNGIAMIHLYLPFDMKNKFYNITIVFSGNGYVESGRYTATKLTLKI